MKQDNPSEGQWLCVWEIMMVYVRGNCTVCERMIKKEVCLIEQENSLIPYSLIGLQP